MKKNNKFHHAGRTVSLLLAICMILCMVPTALAGVTDTDNAETIHTTTENYFTTVKINGVTNPDGEENEREYFELILEEAEGDISDANIKASIDSLKSKLQTWASEKGTVRDITYTEGISDSYVDIHDEVTYSGKVDEFGVSQGTVTIHTIMDWHKTYQINACVYLENAANDPATEITSVTATTGLTYPPVIGQPAGGETQATVPAGASYTCTAYWWEQDEPQPRSAPTKFESGHEYVMTLSFKSTDGSKFSKDCTATVDGKAATQTVLWNNDTEIAFILGPVEPVAGTSPEIPDQPVDPDGQQKTTTLDLLIGGVTYSGIVGNQTIVVSDLNDLKDITVLTQNGVDIKEMSEDWDMSTKFLDSQGRGVLEVQVFEEGDDYVTFNLQSHYADCPGAKVEDFQVMMITAVTKPDATTKPDAATKPTESKQNTETTKSPKTGDNSNLFLWFALLFAGGFGIMATVVGSRRKKTRH